MKIPTISIGSYFNFDWLKKAKLVELKDIDISSDPVRPDLPVSWRTNHGRKMFGLYYGKDLMAVMCFAYTNQVPKTLYELDKLSEVAHLESIHRVGQQGKIAIAYTVWSLQKGGGRMIVNEVHKMIKESNHLNRLVTLSPLTAMAEKFHLRNGAKLLQKNVWSQNFEYSFDDK